MAKVKKTFELLLSSAILMTGSIIILTFSYHQNFILIYITKLNSINYPISGNILRIKEIFPKIKSLSLLLKEKISNIR